MAKFSEFFHLNKSQPELDFVNVDSERDMKLFIDPYAISIRNDEWSHQCNAHISSFFQTALDHIRANRQQEAKGLLNGLGEPNETCLGLSVASPQGRGVSGKQALDLYDKLSESQAARTGILSELADCDLFVEGIGRDKISDITTNIIRTLLIKYTQKQCELHGIELSGTVASGKLWDIESQQWQQQHVVLPIINGKKILLVPKSIVRFRLCLDGQEYYNHYVLNFLQDEHLRAGSSLVTVLKKGTRRVYKKTLKEHFPFNKEWMAEFTKTHPDVLRKYKEFLKNVPSNEGMVSHRDLDEDFDEVSFARSLVSALEEIPSGNNDASRYHSFIVGVLEFIFWPNLIYPQKEDPIHDGRKRIDITYTNAAKDGFFYRIHTAHSIAANVIMVECKNYTKDPANPELDQISGRFSTNRGKFGFLLYRRTDNYERLIARCKDTAGDNRGFVIPLGDEQIIIIIGLIAEGKRKQIDSFLDSLFKKLIS